MKKLIIHFIPVGISFLWLAGNFGTLNPITIKGPEFLKFYIILILGFYISIFIVKSLRESISKTTCCYILFIFLLGIIKLMRGILLEKPIGFLAMILIGECIVTLVFILPHFKNKIKY